MAMTANTRCYNCSKEAQCVYTDEDGYLCADCLLKQVAADKLTIGATDPQCAYCNDGSAYACESCATNKCDSCDSESEVYCEDCAQNYWSVGSAECDMCERVADLLRCDEHMEEIVQDCDTCYAAATVGFCDDHKPTATIGSSTGAALPAVIIDDDGTMSTDGIEINWS